MNNTKLSTNYGGNGSANGEDIYSAPDFQEVKRDDAKRPVSSLSNVTHRLMKKQVEIYSRVDESFLDKKPKDPYKFIDKKT